MHERRVARFAGDDDQLSGRFRGRGAPGRSGEREQRQSHCGDEQAERTHTSMEVYQFFELRTTGETILVRWHGVGASQFLANHRLAGGANESSHG
jgi:hypothetical protein